MNRAKIQDYIDQREEQRSLIYHIEEKKIRHILPLMVIPRISKGLP